jgi:hypothetical protein
MSDQQTEVEQKKEQQQNSNTNKPGISATNTKQFMSSVVMSIINICIYFILSGFILYGCKVAQSNILPTEYNCYPYENDKPTINPIDCNIFETLFKDPNLSDKINFPVNGTNMTNTLLDFLRKIKLKNHNAFIYSLIVSVESVANLYYKFFNFILNWLNQLPEIVVVLFGPILMMFLCPLMLGVNSIYYIFLSFYNLLYLLYKKDNTIDTPIEEYKWTELYGLSWFLGVFYIIIIAIFLGWIFFAAAGFVSLILLFWCLFSIFNYTGKMNNNPVTALNIIGEMFGQYKMIISSIFSFYIIISAYSNVGVVGLVSSLAVIFAIYKGWLSLGIFTKGEYEGQKQTLMVSKGQAIKTCPNSNVTKPVDETFLEVLFSAPKKYKEEMKVASGEEPLIIPYIIKEPSIIKEHSIIKEPSIIK